MWIFDAQKLVFLDGILAEPRMEDNRLTLWLPAGQEGGFEQWERITTVVRARVTDEAGLWSTPAISLRARRRLLGFFGTLVKRFQPTANRDAWVLPNGQSAEQCGDRQTDLLLVWPKDEAMPLDESTVRRRWPDSTRVLKIAHNVFVVAGVPTSQEGNGEAPQGQPQAIAEQWLVKARQASDCPKVAAALTELGILALRAGNARHAIGLLQEALDIVRRLGDRAREHDVLGNLGLALLASGDTEQALRVFQEELANGRTAHDPFIAKAALEHLGLVYANRREPTQALAWFVQALPLVRQVSDQRQESDLLWHLGIQYAELGQRDQALTHAQAAVDLMRQVRPAEADWFADHLHKYQTNETMLSSGIGLQPGGPASMTIGAPIVATIGSAQTSPVGRQAGPSLLKMAMTATQSLARFVGSGLEKVTHEVYQERLHTCAACPHHTGLRCRLCGCFTHAKAWLPHEHCPLGKWAE